MFRTIVQWVAALDDFAPNPTLLLLSNKLSGVSFGIAKKMKTCIAGTSMKTESLPMRQR
jgi:hypothetical protein